MHRLNLTIDESLYEQARAVSFIEKKSISQLVRESLQAYLNSDSRRKAQSELLLEADDEAAVREILANDTFSSDEAFRKKFGL